MNWKNLVFLIIFSLSINTPLALFSQPAPALKIWKGNDMDDGSIHALGNGRMLAYARGSHIIKLYPAPYSTPSILKLELIDDGNTESASAREPGTAIWTHRIFQHGKSIGAIIDFVDAGLPCLVRHFTLTETIGFRLRLKENIQVLNQSERLKSEIQPGSLLLIVPPGTIFYQKYAYPGPLYHQILWQGNITVKAEADQENEYTMTINPGESELYFVGGPEYPQVIENTEKVRTAGADLLMEQTRASWQEFTARRKDFEQRLPATLPLRQKLLQVIDDVSVMIKTQQAREGSVMAGYPYPLGYVRDQYGVSRCLLALGYAQEAEAILNFYWNIWRKYGKIHNAQGIGIEGVFHIHENDEVEVPGYLITQAFDLLGKTGNTKFMEKIFPMLEWGWEVQKKHLVRGMLPFNGDETYVAGGFLPRSALNDGSSEATMLFIDSGEKLLGWINKNHKWPASKIEQEKAVLLAAKHLFRENFWKNGQLITNNPERVGLKEIPRFRHGVCERSGPECLVYGQKGGFSGIDWTGRDENNRYQCPACLASGPLPAVAPRVYQLISVSFTPVYMHSSLLNAEELRPVVTEVYERFAKTGNLSCISDASTPGKESRSVGYDYGLLLFSMLATGLENAEIVYTKTLAVTDSSGVWAEYYEDHAPAGTRYRPWESGINLEALLEFARQYQ